ncbi:hypothetical protein CHU92_01535 [Flavobacterium cyanobacteriorum]|uniref:DUF2842 domain-containing protein n=1 Tax=Flavobacterium cyanobacteriorum TaxID=2022802 RepID=A0A255ZXW8_9FLAO|nr:hypothetical protein [Flavobacterium cyanobacteriorum]OYQ46333.1 hypothetical protein CHU92_01535 [Flavobacterium cyanobacteriorum]
MQEWKRNGLLTGAVFYIITIVILPVAGGEKLSIIKLFLGLPLWAITGCAMSWLYNDRAGKKATRPKRKR